MFLLLDVWSAELRRVRVGVIGWTFTPHSENGPRFGLLVKFDLRGLLWLRQVLLWSLLISFILVLAAEVRLITVFVFCEYLFDSFQVDFTSL
jgi:hypothetical protein